ncbi:hypothetical protein [Saccharopolyspora pogona]|nr:hypothetical protein [Saccharopolyspora pogona]
MSIRPPVNYRMSRWLLVVVLAIAMLASILFSATSCADVVTSVLNNG